MNLLLDTHIILWSVSNPEKLSPDVAGAIKEESNRLWFSPISAWEIFLLAEKGRIGLKAPISDSIRKIILQLSLSEAPLNLDVAIQSRELAVSHQDPADRFLAATALVHDLTLVTSDSRLIESKGIAIFANRGSHQHSP